MSPDKLVYVANQIGKFFASQGEDTVPLIADHLVKFWDPRMRRGIIEYVAASGAGLDPAVQKAVESLQSVPHALDPVFESAAIELLWSLRTVGRNPNPARLV